MPTYAVTTDPDRVPLVEVAIPETIATATRSRTTLPVRTTPWPVPTWRPGIRPSHGRAEPLHRVLRDPAVCQLGVPPEGERGGRERALVPLPELGLGTVPRPVHGQHPAPPRCGQHLPAPDDGGSPVPSGGGAARAGADLHLPAGRWGGRVHRRWAHDRRVWPRVHLLARHHQERVPCGGTIEQLHSQLFGFNWILLRQSLVAGRRPARLGDVARIPGLLLEGRGADSLRNHVVHGRRRARRTALDLRTACRTGLRPGTRRARSRATSPLRPCARKPRWGSRWPWN